jgi:SAM-dependent methyltransferase
MSTATAAACAICGGMLVGHFEGVILERIPVQYHLCTRCHSLMLPEPAWLDEAYARKWTPDPDAGSLRRSLVVYRVIRRLRAAGLLQSRFRALDVGSGKGELLRLLLDEDQDAWGFDRYPAAAFAEERVMDRWPQGPFELISAIEVLEHLPSPSLVFTEISKRLHPNGVLIASTVLFDELRHGSDWPYLAGAFGQHVTLYSTEGLAHAARSAGLLWITTLPWLGEDCLHILVPASRSVPEGTVDRLRQMHCAGEAREPDDSWA